MHPVASMVSAAAKGPGPIAAILSPRRATSALRRGRSGSVDDNSPGDREVEVHILS